SGRRGEPRPASRRPAVLADGVEEAVEERRRLVRPGCRLRVVLGREDRLALDGEPLERAVVQVQVGRPDAGGQALRIDREAVVLAGDRDLAGDQVLDRLIAAVVAELQLEGAPAQREPEELVPEADAEDRRTGLRE